MYLVSELEQIYCYRELIYFQKLNKKFYILEEYKELRINKDKLNKWNVTIPLLPYDKIRDLYFDVHINRDWAFDTKAEVRKFIDNQYFSIIFKENKELRIRKKSDDHIVLMELFELYTFKEMKKVIKIIKNNLQKERKDG